MKLNWSYITIPAIIGLIGFLGKTWTQTGMDWYHTLVLPVGTPPDWVFPWVWQFIYICCAGVLMYIWNTFERNQAFTKIIALFGINGTANFLWSYLFFYHHLVAFAWLDCAIIWLTTMLLILLVGKQSWYVASFLIPYACWVSLASYLNGMIWYLNCHGFWQC